MPAPHFFSESLGEIGLDPAKVQAVLDRAERDVKEGLIPACQIAIARHGKIGAMQTLGRAVQGGVEKPATNETFFLLFSSTKAIVSAAAWLLIQEGKLRPEDPVVKYIPEFGTNGKEAVTLDHCLTHTCGFPFAPVGHREWSDPKRRLERFAQWRLDHAPGAKFLYHAAANFFPIAEVIERVSGQDIRDFVRARIAEPLGLPDLRLGIPPALNGRVADIQYVGQALTAEDYAKMGIKSPLGAIASMLDEKIILDFNDPALREAGSPAAGGVMTAGDLALFYQALLNDGRSYDGKQVWRPEMLREAFRIRTGGLTDPYLGCLADRGLGIAIAGDDGQGNLRGFGRTNSATTFGHQGLGGQIAWADPASGISFAYLTNGFDRNDIREGRRRVALSSLAAVCAN
jgi:CubicO group peptidase (beta-lactamase class C family)